MESKLNFLCDGANRDSVMKESYSKRHNILIHGLPENEESPWDKRETTLEIHKNFSKMDCRFKILQRKESLIYIAFCKSPCTAIKNVSADLLSLSLLLQRINQRFFA